MEAAAFRENSIERSQNSRFIQFFDFIFAELFDSRNTKTLEIYLFSVTMVYSLKAQENRIGNYKINHYHLNEESLIVVFAGAGLDFPGEPIEEFKNTLAGFNVSMLFVSETFPTWFNSEPTEDMFAYVASVAGRYKNVAAMGESMGASGALVFPQFYPTVSRVLAFAPQYSLDEDFVCFDERFASASKLYAKQRFPKFVTRSARSKSFVLFGDRDWRDSVHAGMYLVDQCGVTFLTGVGHGVASHLKRGSGANLLRPLVGAFLDFSNPFDSASLRTLVAPLMASEFIDDDYGLVGRAREKTGGTRAQVLPPPSGLMDLTQRAKADQSSISKWSLSDTIEDDAARAISPEVHKPYAFHTDDEERPWWSMTFENLVSVVELRIYNRNDDLGCAGRGMNFAIETQTSAGWHEVFRKENEIVFGGIGEDPFVWRPADPVITSALRIRLLGFGMLHYQKIEAFGEFVVT